MFLVKVKIVLNVVVAVKYLPIFVVVLCCFFFFSKMHTDLYSVCV